MTTGHVVARLAAAEPIGLSELDEAAALQQRVDTKYLIGLEEFDRIADKLAATHRRLVIGDRRAFDYRSSYLDTPGLTCFHDHRQGRRLRFKARTRSYDRGLCRFEVKLKDGRGGTDKHALRVGPADFGTVPGGATGFLTYVLADRYGIAAPAVTPRLLVRHFRQTLVAKSAASPCRVTLDTDLTFTTGSVTAGLRTGLLLVETKSARGRGPADELLRRAGARPVSISKYCAGMALLHPGLPEQPWRNLLRRYFELS
ncbi:polyphosphate polymerase domain-containing protein [Actinoplanes bogorensis]|uniref:Polyphosphate polymerase domain-containing protein n=1 Tax=Paractinoplanes bogorensis TaxID=1610840 RepID=A0ABS5YXQ9_9ACTN|nr:polyphosphate polymerase domain-containing protein [Actinoplanes bogorensis]MBU2667851.1 polyphosphate polymerase domain-containing protein [Actinoplanes bogorensis]